ncbi:hypothetical protein GWK47_018880 [Chionoecetes opilio]|uniref:Uncharacterized protein n=1 Tax=Chionoecetes opilio TaxID=41210 RepID=A0A8J4XQB3_CHIOP|nr:hypothetical protein GWK47_018880 [Chionoecetes opilio]
MGGWNAYVEVTGGLQQLHESPFLTVTVNASQFQLLERFTVISTIRASNLESVNEARRELFSQKKTGQWKRFPQRKKAFCSTHCAPVYQAGIWATSDQCEQENLQPQRALEDSKRVQRRNPASCVVQPACSI